MRLRTILGISSLFLAAVTAWTGTARAEEEFDVSVSGNTVTVNAKGDWHINQGYNWKLVQGSHKLTSWNLGEKTATLSGAPHGHATLKGAVCSKTDDGQSACKMFQKEIDVP